MDVLERQIRDFVHEEVPWLEMEMPGGDVVGESSIYGDDVWMFVLNFSERFKVNVDGFRWYHHTGPDGCNPLWLFYRPWWARKTYVPIRLADLLESARRGRWSIEYPENEREF
jgi:hypothetical protein